MHSQPCVVDWYPLAVIMGDGLLVLPVLRLAIRAGFLPFVHPQSSRSADRLSDARRRNGRYAAMHLPSSHAFHKGNLFTEYYYWWLLPACSK